MVREGGGGAAGRSAGVVHAAASDGVRFAPDQQARGAKEGSPHTDTQEHPAAQCLQAFSLRRGCRWACGKVPCSVAARSAANAALAAALQPPPCLPCQPNPLQDSAVGFLLQLDNGAKVQAHVFLCYADAQPCSHAAAAASSSGGGGGEEERFAW